MVSIAEKTEAQKILSPDPASQISPAPESTFKAALVPTILKSEDSFWFREFSATNQFFIAFFAWFNAACLHLICRLSIFDEVSGLLETIAISVSNALAGTAALFCLWPVGVRAARDLVRGRIEADAIKLMLLLVLGLGLVTSSFPASSLIAAPISLILFLSIDACLVAWLEKSFRLKRGFRVDDLVKQVSLVDITPHSITGELKVLSQPGRPIEAINERQVPLSTVKAGDVFKVQSGEYIPCDAKIVQGNAEIGARRLSAALSLMYLGPGEQVFAGSKVIQGNILCQAESGVEDATITTFAGVLNRQLREEDEAKVPGQIWLNVAGGFIILLAIGLVFLSPNMTLGINRALGLLSLGLFLRFVLVWRNLRGLAATEIFARGALLGNLDVADKLRNISNLVIDVPRGHRPGRNSVLSFEILDDRLDRTAMVSVLLSLFGVSDDELEIALTRFLRTQVKQPILHPIKDYHFYPGKGVIAVINGLEVSAGSEEFLIERGVYLQPTDIPVGVRSDLVTLIGLNDEVVARFVLADPFNDDGKQLVSNLARLGTRTILAGEMPQAELDELGKSAQMELANIFGGLSETTYVQKLEALRPAALYTSDRLPQSILESAALACGVFNELLWNWKNFGLTFFSRELDAIVHVLKAVRSYELNRKLMMYALPFFVLVLSGLVANSLVSVNMALFIGLLALFGSFKLFLTIQKS